MASDITNRDQNQTCDGILNILYSVEPQIQWSLGKSFCQTYTIKANQAEQLDNGGNEIAHNYPTLSEVSILDNTDCTTMHNVATEMQKSGKRRSYLKHHCAYTMYTTCTIDAHIPDRCSKMHI